MVELRLEFGKGGGVGDLVEAACDGKVLLYSIVDVPTVRISTLTNSRDGIILRLDHSRRFGAWMERRMIMLHSRTSA